MQASLVAQAERLLVPVPLRLRLALALPVAVTWIVVLLPLPEIFTSQNDGPPADSTSQSPQGVSADPDACESDLAVITHTALAA